MLTVPFIIARFERIPKRNELLLDSEDLSLIPVYLNAPSQPIYLGPLAKGAVVNHFYYATLADVLRDTSYAFKNGI